MISPWFHLRQYWGTQDFIQNVIHFFKAFSYSFPLHINPCSTVYLCLVLTSDSQVKSTAKFFTFNLLVQKFLTALWSAQRMHVPAVGHMLGSKSHEFKHCNASSCQLRVWFAQFILCAFSTLNYYIQITTVRINKEEIIYSVRFAWERICWLPSLADPLYKWFLCVTNHSVSTGCICQT